MLRRANRPGAIRYGGLAALAGYLDYLLFAALAIGLSLYARYHKRKQDAGFTNEDSEKRDD